MRQGVWISARDYEEILRAVTEMAVSMDQIGGVDGDSGELAREMWIYLTSDQHGAYRDLSRARLLLERSLEGSDAEEYVDAQRGHWVYWR